MELIINSIITTGIGLAFWAIWLWIGYKSINFFTDLLFGENDKKPLWIICGTIFGIITFIAIVIVTLFFIAIMDDAGFFRTDMEESKKWK